MSTAITRWRIPPAAWAPIGLATAAEALSNALRAYGLGTHLEPFTLHVYGTPVSLAGAVLVAASVAMSIGQGASCWQTFRPGLPVRQRLVTCLALVLLLAVSVAAMVSHVLEAQRLKTSDEGTQRGAYDRAKAGYDKLVGQLAQLKRYGPDGKQLPRDGQVVAAEIRKVPINMGVWRRSMECTDITLQESKDACKPILALYEERGAHASLVQLEPKLKEAKEELDHLRRPEQAEVSESFVSLLWPWIMGLGVVFIATFGPVIFARVEQVEASEPTAERSPGRRDSEQTSFPPGREIDVPVDPRWFGPDEPNGSPNSHPNGGGGRTVRRLTKEEAVADLVTRLALGERFGSQDELRERYGVAKSTMSNWLTEWERSGLIPARTQDGRCKALAGA